MRNGYQPKRSATISSSPTTGSNVVLPHNTLTIKVESKQELKDVCYALRQKLKISQRELAFLIGSTQTEISFIEKRIHSSVKRKDIQYLSTCKGEQYQ